LDFDRRSPRQGFRSTPLREGRPLAGTQIVEQFSGFDPRPCARGDMAQTVSTMFRSVSIHAPARGATGSSAPASSRSPFFRSTPLREGRPGTVVGLTHEHEFRSTPLREGRQGALWRRLQQHRFDPRPCARGDPGDSRIIIDVLIVSIHAPARGATGRDRDSADHFMFRSTPLREGRPFFTTTTASSSSEFRSTPLREGRQAAVRKFVAEVDVSIHAPARGATVILRWLIRINQVSIHAPARGATLC